MVRRQKARVRADASKPTDCYPHRNARLGVRTGGGGPGSDRGGRRLGRQAKGVVVPPQTWLGALNRLGQLDIVTVSVQHGDQEVPQFSPARYYHLRVTNRAVHPEAREVEVLLTQLDFQGPDGRPQTNFTGALPLGWQYYPRQRTIGRASVAIE